MKKFIAGAVAGLMLAASIPAFGADKSITAEEAIAIAKTILPISDELSRFNYNQYDGVYSLSWNDEDYERSASAIVTESGVIIGYNSYDGGSSGLSELRKSQLADKAREFLDTVIPELSPKLVLSEESNSRRMIFNRYENGARVEGNSAVIYINRVSGKVEDYSLSWDFDTDFSGVAGEPIAPEAALKALSENALKLEYRTFWDDEVEYDSAFPVYRAISSARINALSGEAFTGGADMGENGAKYSMNTMAQAEDSAASGGSGRGTYKLSPQELEQVEAMNSLITKDQAREKIASLNELWLPEEYELSMSYYSNAYGDEITYTATANADWDEGYGRVTMDGKSGEVSGIYIYRDDSYTISENPVSDEDCFQVADSLLNKLGSMEGYRLNSEAANYESKRVSISRSYMRYIDDIPYPDDYKIVNVSKNSGKATSYYKGEGAKEIYTPKEMVTAEAAAAKNYTAELVYTYSADGGAATLAYALKPNSSFYMVRAEDGAPISYSGTVAEPDAEKTAEPDHWAWPVFEILRENDIYISGDYSLDDKISYADFDQLIRRVAGVSPISYRWHKLSDEHLAAESLTREQAAREIMESLGWEQLIGLDVFTTKFADEADFAGGIGGAAILQGLGVMQGDGGFFHPARDLTYGEAYLIIYNLAVMQEAE